MEITNKNKQAMPRKGITDNLKRYPKGSPNKITQNLRSWFSKLIDKNRDQIQRNLAALPSKERLQVLEKFMQYTIPKMPRPN